MYKSQLYTKKCIRKATPKLRELDFEKNNKLSRLRIRVNDLSGQISKFRHQIDAIVSGQTTHLSVESDLITK